MPKEVCGWVPGVHGSERQKEARAQEMEILHVLPLCLPCHRMPPNLLAPSCYHFTILTPSFLPETFFCFQPCQRALEKKCWKEGWWLNWDSVMIYYNKMWTVGNFRHQRICKREVPSSWEPVSSVMKSRKKWRRGNKTVGKNTMLLPLSNCKKPLISLSEMNHVMQPTLQGKEDH